MRGDLREAKQEKAKEFLQSRLRVGRNEGIESLQRIHGDECFTGSLQRDEENMLLQWAAGLSFLMLPRAFAPPFPAPIEAHHQHSDHGNTELHAEPNGIQGVHRPPTFLTVKATGCIPLRAGCRIPFNTTIMNVSFGKRDGTWSYRLMPLRLLCA